jgi:hypothetical protein
MLHYSKAFDWYYFVPILIMPGSGTAGSFKKAHIFTHRIMSLKDNFSLKQQPKIMKKFMEVVEIYIRLSLT